MTTDSTTSPVFIGADKNRQPTVTLPAGIDLVGDWDLDGHRALYGFDRTVTDHEVHVYAQGSQAPDGTIYDLTVYMANGERSGPQFNSDQARELAAALIQTAAELDGWAAK